MKRSPKADSVFELFGVCAEYQKSVQLIVWRSLRKEFIKTGQHIRETAHKFGTWRPEYARSKEYYTQKKFDHGKAAIKEQFDVYKKLVGEIASGTNDKEF